MRNNEDYLDSLLNNVTKKLSEFDEDFEQKKQASDVYMTKKNLPPKTMKALETVRENQFLREFEDELRQDDADSFLKAFEAELDEEVQEFERIKEAQTADENDAYMDQIDQLLRASSAEPQADDLLSGLEPEDYLLDESVPGEERSMGSETDGPLMDGYEPEEEMQEPLEPDEEAIAEPDEEAIAGPDEEAFAGPDAVTFAGSDEEAFAEPETDAAEILREDLPDFPDMGALSDLMPEQGADAPPEGMEALERLFDEDGDLGALSDLMPEDGGVLPESADEETILPEDDEELDDEGILNLLNGMSEDEALSDIGKMLEADEQSISLDDLSAEPENLAHAADLAESRQASVGEKKKKKHGFLAKLMDLFFGEDADDEETDPVREAGDLDNISDENMDILREMEGDKLTEPDGKANKKGKKKKDKKKKEPKEKKEKKQKEPKEKKPRKPKKEKKPAEKGPREKPLPKGSVRMIWILALSIFALVFIGNNLLSHGNAVSLAQQCFDRGDYVGSYGALNGIKIGSSETELYERAKVLAGVQTELNAYYSMMEVRKFDLALDCLVRALGRSDLHMAKAEEWGVATQMNTIISETTMQLMDQFNVTEEQARELYALEDREEYSLAIDEVLTGLGLK